MGQASYLDITITATALATIVAALLASCVSLFLYKFNSKRDEKKRLYDSVFMINSYWLKYPYLENGLFIEEWNNNHKNNKMDERYLRYEAYCTLWFNCLNDICVFFKYKKDKVEKFFYIKEIILSHKSWWSHPPEEIDKYNLAYSDEFRNFINKYL